MNYIHPGDIVNQCRHRLSLIATFLLSDKAVENGLRLTPAMTEAVYYSLSAIEDDLNRVSGMISDIPRA